MTTMTRELTWTGAQQREHVRMACAALRSGDYAQGGGYLLKKVDGACLWCIIGVLTDVARRECPELGDWVWCRATAGPECQGQSDWIWNAPAECAEWMSGDGRSAMSRFAPPDHIELFYGLTVDGVDRMVADNDNRRYAFADFARALEQALAVHDGASPDGAAPDETPRYRDVFAFND